MRINERILTVVFLMLEMSGHSALAATGVMLDGREVAPNRVIVQWKQPSGVDTDLAGAALGTKLAQLSKQLAARGGADLAGFHTIKTFAKLPGLAVLEVPAAPASIALKAVPNEDGVANLKTRIAALMATGKFESVEPDYIVYANTLPNDAALVDGRLWGLRNTGQSGGVAGTDIGAGRRLGYHHRFK